MVNKLIDKNVQGYKTLITPADLKELIPLSREAEDTVSQGREDIERIMDRMDSRKIIIVGPCSIHDPEGALEYADKLKVLSERVKSEFLIIMRAYLEKPRTTTGWKGLIYDPNLDGSHDIGKGLTESRTLLSKIAEIGIPTATEFLGTLTPQYIDDLVTWAAIGARTSESQPHRELVSGLSVPVGFKNTTYGDVDAAVNAIKASKNPHTFIGQDSEGRVSVVHTMGNKYTHIILRGGNGKPNYNPELVQETLDKLRKAGLPENVMIDCSHGNSNKDYNLQPEVFEKVVGQIQSGNLGVIGMMIESYLKEGSQNVSDPLLIESGVSITDACISFERTEEIIMGAYNKLRSAPSDYVPPKFLGFCFGGMRTRQ